jgi:hypothetical protein
MMRRVANEANPYLSSSRSSRLRHAKARRREDQQQAAFAYDWLVVRRFNWQLWSGFALSVVALISYFAFFARFPITRDVPWVNLILFAIAIPLLVIGLRRAPGRRIGAWIATVFGVLLCVLFCFDIFIGAKWLPASSHAPAVGSKAPDFVLLDIHRKPMALAGLLAEPATKGVLLIFYRGYW